MKCFRNPFDISKVAIIDELVRRKNVFEWGIGVIITVQQNTMAKLSHTIDSKNMYIWKRKNVSLVLWCYFIDEPDDQQRDYHLQDVLCNQVG